MAKFPNVKDAWILLLVDNVPPQIRPQDVAWEVAAIEARAIASLGSREMGYAEEYIKNHRKEGDMEDLESPIWLLVCRMDEDTRKDERVDKVLDWLFDNAI
jgi:hypothetical protein